MEARSAWANFSDANSNHKHTLRNIKTKAGNIGGGVLE